MAFLTSIDILDTGFLNLNNRTGQVSTANRVNAGTAVRLKGVSIEFESSANLDEGVTPDNHDIIRDSKAEQHALISINPTTFTMTIKINALHTDASNYYAINDAAILPLLLRIPHTRGIKAMFYAVDNTTTDTGSNSSNRRDSQLVTQLGAADTSEDQGDINLTLWTGTATASSKDLTDVNYIGIRFKTCKEGQTVNNIITVILTGIVTQ